MTPETRSVTVEVRWPIGLGEHWLNADNIAIALNAYCPSTEITVHDARAEAALEGEEQ
ncbi:MAG: hypothetical protein ACE5HA_03350 [Anaerolineae bacterium]